MGLETQAAAANTVSAAALERPTEWRAHYRVANIPAKMHY
jgi:hypothetical protein